MKSMMRNLGCALFAVSLFLPTAVSAVAIFSDAGANVASITDTVNAFRAALGDPNNANNAGPLATGRREINWDGGVPPAVNGTAPITPFTTFENSRGATFFTPGTTAPGTGLTQAPATGGTGSLDAINPQYSTLFAPFSPNRLFTPIGDNLTAGFFSIPGSGGTLPAAVSGFGVVFSDVDLADTTLIGFINDRGEAFGPFSVPPFPGNQTFSFLGLLTQPGEGLIAAVAIVTGNSPLGPAENLPTLDLVVMDDFLYGEPQRIAEPQTFALLSAALAILFVMVRRSRRR